LHVPVTPDEIARHQGAIERIRRQLFREYTPSDYLIVEGSEEILAPSAQTRWNAACGDYRELTLGGLCYMVDCLDRDGLTKVTILHQRAHEFAFWMQTGRGNTVCSLVVPFRVLDVVAFGYVTSFRRENAAARPQRR
jgi:hypothetical protein